MTEPPFQPSPMAEALEWVSRITAVAAVMVLPGVGGLWLDKRLETSFIGLIGFAFGMVMGFWYLVLIARPRQPRDGSSQKNGVSQKNR